VCRREEGGDTDANSIADSSAQQLQCEVAKYGRPSQRGGCVGTLAVDLERHRVEAEIGAVGHGVAFAGHDRLRHGSLRVNPQVDGWVSDRR
jgi:hypothetical protein